jgi:hypothetical protein
MTPTDTLREITSCFADWEGLLANQRSIRVEKVVCWPNYIPRIEDHVSWSTITSLATDLQYSFQLFDGSLIQLLYDFSSPENALKSARLAYYEGTQTTDQDEQIDGEISPVEDDEEERLPRWMRLDFGRQNDPSCIHAECHLHLCNLPTTRISCGGVPGPRQFLEGVIAWFYPDLYRQRVLQCEPDVRTRRYIDVNRHSHFVAPSDHFHSLLHIALPRSIRTPANANET